nr:hypothetical protein [Tanacetum cinerariifolium]
HPPGYPPPLGRHAGRPAFRHHRPPPHHGAGHDAGARVPQERRHPAASKGLGRAVAEELAAEGASLVLCARGEEALQQTRAALEAAYGVPVLAVAADLSTIAGVAQVTGAAFERFGRVDIL